MTMSTLPVLEFQSASIKNKLNDFLGTSDGPVENESVVDVFKDASRAKPAQRQDEGSKAIKKHVEKIRRNQKQEVSTELSSWRNDNGDDEDDIDSKVAAFGKSKKKRKLLMKQQAEPVAPAAKPPKQKKAKKAKKAAALTDIESIVEDILPLGKRKSKEKIPEKAVEKPVASVVDSKKQRVMEDDAEARPKKKRKRKKTRSKQKNRRKDNRPEELKPGYKKK